MKRRDGFTLIELITVLAVIGLLATILIPSFTKVLTFSRRATCMSNLKQLASAVLAYKDSNDDVLPPHKMEPVPSPQRWWGYDKTNRDAGSPGEGDIWSYVTKAEVFQCPELGAIGWEFTSDHVGYGYNAWFLGRYDGTDGEPGDEAGLTPDKWCKFSYVRNSSELIVFGDSIYRPGLGDRAGSYAMWYPTLGAGVDTARHGGRGCVVFFDGSAAPFTDEEINPDVAPTSGNRPHIRYWDPRQRL